jgi:hypothetical protein
MNKMSRFDRRLLDPTELGFIVRLEGSDQEWQVDMDGTNAKLLKWVTYTGLTGWQPVEDAEWAERVRQNIARIT